ncbi:MAG: trypsin-like serine peptidase [Neptuniibacter sp.]
MRKIELVSFLAISFSSSLLLATNAVAVSENASDRAKEVLEFWTPAKRAVAIPRDLFLDEKGQGYIRGNKGNIVPYGGKLKAPITPMARGGNGGKGGGNGGGGSDGGSDGGSGGTPNDTVVNYISPTESNNLVTSLPKLFTAYVEDPNGLKNVNFKFQLQGSADVQQVAPTCVNSGSGKECSVQVTSIANGNWDWWLDGKDGSRKGGQTFSSTPLNFDIAIDETSSSNCGGSTVDEGEWDCGGQVQTAAGRIFFQMNGIGYVCSGTVVNEAATDRSVILTAAHCVYDDANKEFATYAMFIPDQAGTTGLGTDSDCSNDPLGCWVVSFGVVDPDWTASVFPDNIPWDYAYYVVENQGSHVPALNSGADADTPLDVTAGTMDISFVAPQTSQYTYALGYSYSQDPSFRYCAENMTTNGASNWWLNSCDLSGGSSGGPWTQSTADDLGTGPVMSVNSWGYKQSPGMAGPKLNGNTASCLFTRATSQVISEVTNNGVVGCTEN